MVRKLHLNKAVTKKQTKNGDIMEDKHQTKTEKEVGQMDGPGLEQRCSH